MALRQIRTYGDPVLEKKCKEVKEMTPRLQELVDDMLETLYEQDGVGLAAPQVGILRRITVIDLGIAEGEDEAEAQAEESNETQELSQPDNVSPDGRIIPVWEGPLVLINPVITEQSGEQTGDEGCLSLPGKVGTVTRPQKVTVEALDLDMNPVRYEGEDLLARAFCHELDHLDGHMYTELVKDGIRDVNYEEEE